MTTKQYIKELVAEYTPTYGELSRINRLILRTQLEKLVLLAKVEFTQEIKKEANKTVRA